MTRIAIRREIADLILEALEIAISRKLAHHQTHAFVLEVIAAERPDLTHAAARALVGRLWQRLAEAQPAAAGGD